MRDFHSKKVSDQGKNITMFNKLMQKGAYEANITDRVVF